MNLNDLLISKGIDPKTVLVLRHSPKEGKLKKELLRLAVEKPEVFNAYQQTQTKQVEKEMTRADYVASFIGHEPAKALFVGLYTVKKFRPITPKEYWQIPANVELKAFGVKGLTEDSPPFSDPLVRSRIEV